jgi:hypothetical protein
VSQYQQDTLLAEAAARFHASRNKVQAAGMQQDLEVLLHILY